MKMILAGPEQARPGELVMYTLSYDNLLGITVDIRFEWTGLSFASAQRLSGAGTPAPEPAGTSVDGESTLFAWRSDPGSGALEFVLWVREDVASDSIGGHTWLIGTCVPFASSVRTAVIRQ
jgi:hypothetical protein